MDRWVWRLTASAALAITACGGQEPSTAALRERALAVLRTGFASDEFWPSMHAAEGLTKAGLGAEVVSALAPRLAAETDDQRRCGLAREQVRAGVEAPVAVLATILADTQSNGRVHAAESLFKVNRMGSRQALEQALRADVVPLEVMAAAALARQGDATVLQQVRRRLSDPDLTHRRLAAWVLGQLGGEEDVAPIRRLAESETEPLARSFFWNALARLHAEGALDVVLANLAATDPGVRAYAVESVGVCGDASHLSRLAAMLNDTALDVRIRAAEAIVVVLGRGQPPGGAILAPTGNPAVAPR